MFDHLLSFLITNAHADVQGAQNAAPQGGGLSFLIMFGFLFLILYFGIWRPQSKRLKEQQTLMGSLAKGDEVITAGGVLGKITKLSEHYITLTIANNVEIVVQKGAVVTVLPKGTLKAID